MPQAVQVRSVVTVSLLRVMRTAVRWVLWLMLAAIVFTIAVRIN